MPKTPPAPRPDAEVSFFTRDLNTVLPRAKIAAVASLDEVLTRVRDAANWDGNSGQKTAAILTTSMPATLTAYAPERHGDPYAGFEPRIVPENVTLLPKTTAQVTGGNACERTHHRAQEGRFRFARSCARWARRRTR